jgi:hypothetical protein
MVTLVCCSNVMGRAVESQAFNSSVADLGYCYAFILATKLQPRNGNSATTYSVLWTFSLVGNVLVETRYF